MVLDKAYWMALAHLPKMTVSRKNNIIIRCYESDLSISDLYKLDNNDLKNTLSMNESEIELFNKSKSELSNYSFIAEDLLDQGYNIIPITSSEYSPTMKKNMKKRHSPPLIYTKGNQKIMQEDSTAVVGSRKAGKTSLDFTDNIAKKASKEFKVIVSGFAKGVDKQALLSALKYKGQSIIVLPQGILTFSSGLKKYYKQIVQGDVLVLSAFHPKAPWSVNLAMARNPIIYGLAKNIYVAESNKKGGTWSGVNDGLKKGRKIYVRKPENNEKNANEILIKNGAVPVDKEGNITDIEKDKIADKTGKEMIETEKKIIDLLKKGEFTSKYIVDKLKLDWKSQQVTSFLKGQEDVKIVKEKPLQFTHKESIAESQEKLF